MDKESMDPGPGESEDASEKIPQNWRESKHTITRVEKILAYTSLVLGCVSFLAIIELGILFLRTMESTWIDAGYAFVLRAMLSISLASASGFLGIVTGMISLARIRNHNIDTRSKDGRNLRLVSIWGSRLSRTGLTLVLLFFIALFFESIFRFL